MSRSDRSARIRDLEDDLLDSGDRGSHRRNGIDTLDPPQGPDPAQQSLERLPVAGVPLENAERIPDLRCHPTQLCAKVAAEALIVGWRRRRRLSGLPQSLGKELRALSQVWRRRCERVHHLADLPYRTAESFLQIRVPMALAGLQVLSDGLHRAGGPADRLLVGHPGAAAQRSRDPPQLIGGGRIRGRQDAVQLIQILVRLVGEEL